MSPLGALGLSLLLVGGSPAERTGLKWEKSFEEALKKARASGRPVLIDFWAEWCGWCHRLDQTTYVDPVVVKLGEGFVPVKVDTEGARKQQEIAERYDVGQLPTILFVSPEGRALLRVQGYQGPGQFPSTMEKARQIGAKVMAWEAAIDEDPKDSLALMRLGVHMFEQEFYEESRELLSRAARADRGSPTHDRRKARMLLGIIQTYDKKYADAEKVLQEALAIEPEDELEPRLLFVLGRAYFNWGKYDKSRVVMERIVSTHSGSAVAGKARDTLAALDRKKR
jgi:thioredoxin-like negative regulator of GroEL